MHIVKSVARRIRHNLPAIVTIWAIGVVILALTLGPAVASGIAPNFLIGDALDQLDAPFYVGAISFAGIMLWAASGAICLFSFFLLRRLGAPRQQQSFLLVFGLFSLALGLDDLYQFHEDILPALTGRWMAQRAILLAYAGLAILLVIRYRTLVTATAYPVLFMAGGLLAFSMGLDQLRPLGVLIGLDFDLALPIHPDAQTILEGGSKFIGIISWASYLAMSAFAFTTTAAAAARGRPAA